jgi:hypothetical protein
MIAQYLSKYHSQEEIEKMTKMRENRVPKEFAVNLPSYIIVDVAINQFIPLSLQESNTKKMRTFY